MCDVNNSRLFVDRNCKSLKMTIIRIQKIIAGRDLTMLLVTHNHKSGNANLLNRVIGSTGLTGVVDGIFVLEKTRPAENTAKLTIATRDTESHQVELRFDKLNCRWQFVGEVSRHR